MRAVHGNRVRRAHALLGLRNGASLPVCAWLGARAQVQPADGMRYPACLGPHYGNYAAVKQLAKIGCSVSGILFVRYLWSRMQSLNPYTACLCWRVLLRGHVYYLTCVCWGQGAGCGRHRPCVGWTQLARHVCTTAVLKAALRIARRAKERTYHELVSSVGSAEP